MTLLRRAQVCQEASRIAFCTLLERKPSTIATARRMENSRARASCLGHSLHHVAVLHARKDMQLHIVLSCCQSAISAQHLLRSAVVAIAPEDANGRGDVLDF